MIIILDEATSTKTVSICICVTCGPPNWDINWRKKFWRQMTARLCWSTGLMGLFRAANPHCSKQVVGALFSLFSGSAGGCTDRVRRGHSLFDPIVCEPRLWLMQWSATADLVLSRELQPTERLLAQGFSPNIVTRPACRYCSLAKLAGLQNLLLAQAQSVGCSSSSDLSYLCQKLAPDSRSTSAEGLHIIPGACTPGSFCKAAHMSLLRSTPNTFFLPLLDLQ